MTATPDRNEPNRQEGKISGLVLRMANHPRM
jgi:hypothetical protein